MAITLGLAAADDSAPGIERGKGASADQTLKGLGLATRADQAIKMFTSLAAQGDIDGLMGMLVLPTGADQTTVRANLSKEIIPFFSDFDQIPGPKVANTATFKFLDNREGLNFYLFAQTKTGSRKPFVIGFVTDGPRTLVAYVDVGHCIEGRHFACP